MLEKQTNSKSCTFLNPKKKILLSIPKFNKLKFLHTAYDSNTKVTNLLGSLIQLPSVIFFKSLSPSRFNK